MITGDYIGTHTGEGDEHGHSGRIQYNALPTCLAVRQKQETALGGAFIEPLATISATWADINGFSLSGNKVSLTILTSRGASACASAPPPCCGRG